MAKDTANVHEEVQKMLKTVDFSFMINDHGMCYMVEKCFKDPGIKIDMTVTILQKLDKCINVLNDDHKRLVQIILEMDWLCLGQELIQTYHSFVLSLLSAHVHYFKPFLNILVKSFKREGEVFDYEGAHCLLKSVCRLIPMTSVVLMPILEHQFPFHNKGMVVHQNYITSLLKISAYAPTLRIDILDLVIKNILNLDVRVSRDVLASSLVKTEEIMEEEDDNMFSLDFGDENQNVKVNDPPEIPAVATLDAVMTVVLTYVRESCYPLGELDWNLTKKLYREILSSFDKYILPTYLSNITQFIIFYICSFKEALADGFIDYLWKKVTDPMTQPIFRQIAACYIGSFLARAKHIPLSTAKALMELMMQWVHNYLDQTCDINRHAGVEHHAAFYSVCQTCFYIFCFKHTQFLQMKRGHKWAESLNFQRVVTSQLNPLKYCSSIIVKTFSSATRMHQLAFCDTIIERNNRYNLPVSSLNFIDTMAKKQLHSFFPFDPYLLKKSRSFISPLYKEFEGNAVDDDVDDSEGEDDFLPDEEDVHLKCHEDKSSIDLLQYSVSPGFQDFNHSDFI